MKYSFRQQAITGLLCLALVACDKRAPSFVKYSSKRSGFFYAMYSLTGWQKVPRIAH